MQLRAYRTAKGLTLEDLAGLTGLGVMTISCHERGVRFPSLRQIEQYRKATGGAVQHEDWAALARRVDREKSRASSSASSPCERKDASDG